MKGGLCYYTFNNRSKYLDRFGMKDLFLGQRSKCVESEFGIV